MYSIRFKLLEEKHLDTGYSEVLSANTPLHSLSRLCRRATHATTTFNYTTLRIDFKTPDDLCGVNEFICIIRFILVLSVPFMNTRRHIYCYVHLPVPNNDDTNNNMVILVYIYFQRFLRPRMRCDPLICDINSPIPFVYTVPSFCFFNIYCYTYTAVAHRPDRWTLYA